MCENLYNKLLFHCYQCWFVFRVTLLFQEVRFRHTSRFIFICWHFLLFFHTEGSCHFLLDSSPKDNIRQPKMVRFFFGSSTRCKNNFLQERMHDGLLSRYAGLDKNQSRHEQLHNCCFTFFFFLQNRGYFLARAKAPLVWRII